MMGSEDNEEFEVDKIVAQRKNVEGIIEYKIRWKGFASDYDTWEPEINLIGCEEVLMEFKLNNGLLENIKKDIEDGEVSETDSSDSVQNDLAHRKIKKAAAGKRRKSKKKNTSKSEISKIKNEFQQARNVEIFNDDAGIKVEIAIEDQIKENSKPQSFTSNFSMGASELLLNYYTNSIPTQAIEPEFKQEITDSTDDVVIIKEEKSCFEIIEEQQSDEADDSDSDLEGQLKVVINDEQDISTERIVEIEEPETVSQSEKARSWREQLDTGNFKIRKSQRKDHSSPLGNGEAAPILGKDKWTVKIKDNQTEAFYNLPVLQSLQEVRIKMDKETAIIKTTKCSVSKEAVIKAIEDGNSFPIWQALMCREANSDNNLNDGELLILASKLGYSDIVGMIIRAGVDVNYQSEEGITPLMTACEYGHELVCHLLILNGAHINFTNKKSESALLKVVTRGQKECLMVLLQHGCDVFSLDHEKAPLQIARQRNLHEMEATITDYHKKLSDMLTSRTMNIMNSQASICYAIFPLRVLSLYEDKNFVFEFNAKIPPVKEDECNLLIIFTGLVQDKQIRCSLNQVTRIQSVVLNDIDQQSLVPNDDNYVMSLSPILDGKNVLNIKCESVVNCRWVRLLVIGFRVKMSSNKAA